MKEQLLNYIKAGYPFIAVNTIEINRAVATVTTIIKEFNKALVGTSAKQYLKEHGYEIFCWDVSSGWLREGEAISTTKSNAREALRFVTQDSIKCGVFIMTNFNKIWEDPIDQRSVVQDIIDLTGRKNKPHTHVIVVGSFATIPPEVAHLFGWIDFTRPDREKLLELASSFDTVLTQPITQEEKEAVADAAAGMTFHEAAYAMRTSIITMKGKAIDRDYVLREKAKAVKRSGLLEHAMYEDTINDVGGLTHLKSHFTKISKAFHDRQKAIDYHLPPARGSLIAGIPGTGKSLIARAIANLFGLPLYNWDIGRLMGSLVGETERNTREVFSLIKSVAPAVIRIDELEKSLTGAEHGTDSGVGNRIMQQLLIELEEGTAPVYYVATANDVNLLPAALLRRLDLWFVDIPSAEEREEIFTIHIKKVQREPKKFSIDELVKATEGFIGSEIRNTIREAMYDAFAKDREFKTGDILRSIKAMPLLVKTKERELAALRSWAKGRARIANMVHDKHPKWYDAATEDMITS